MAEKMSPLTPPQSEPPLVRDLFTSSWWIFFSGVAKTLLDAVRGALVLTTVGKIPKVTSAGTLGQSSLTDDGTNVSGTEPLHLDTGTTPQNSQLMVKANSLGAIGMLAYAADNVKVMFDCEWTAGVLIALNTSVAVVLKNGAKLNVYGATGATVGNAVTPAQLFSIDLATGNVDAVTGVYKVAGTQVVGARLAAITAPSGGGTSVTAASGGGSSVSAPAGGATIDSQARTAINSLITAVSSSGDCVDVQARAAIVSLIAAIASTGNTVDVNSRTAIGTIISRLSTTGITA